MTSENKTIKLTTIPEDEFNIQEFSHAIEAQARILEAKKEQLSAAEYEWENTEEITLPIEISRAFDNLDEEVELIDTLINKIQPVYRDLRGSYIKHRIAILGIGKVVEDVYDRLHRQFADKEDLIDLKSGSLKVRYDVALFGGKPRGDEIIEEDVGRLATLLAAYSPNTLFIVNSGAIKQHLADCSVKQLALITHCINRGAAINRQRPYTLIFVVDKKIEEKHFDDYLRACQQLATTPAMIQFAINEVEEAEAYLRFDLERYANHHLKLSRPRSDK